MEKIEINEENYMEYQDFLNSKMGLPKKHLILWAIGIAILVLATAIGIMVGAVLIEELVWGIIGKFFPIKATSNILIPELIRWMSFSAFSMGSAFLGLKAVLSITMGYIPMKMFQKKHPDFDINIDATEVEKELEKYYQLSKLPKDIVKQKEEHLENYGESMREISVEERLELLKREKEFWEQVAIQEKYQETGEETIGQTSTKEEKVYHI